MGNKPQFIYHTKKGDKDIFFWMERIEKRLSSIEDYLVKEIQEEWENPSDTSVETVNPSSEQKETEK